MESRTLHRRVVNKLSAKVSKEREMKALVIVALVALLSVSALADTTDVTTINLTIARYAWIDIEAASYDLTVDPHGPTADTVTVAWEGGANYPWTVTPVLSAMSPAAGWSMLSPFPAFVVGQEYWELSVGLSGTGFANSLGVRYALPVDPYSVAPGEDYSATLTLTVTETE